MKAMYAIDGEKRHYRWVTKVEHHSPSGGYAKSEGDARRAALSHVDEDTARIQVPWRMLVDAWNEVENRWHIADAHQ